MKGNPISDGNDAFVYETYLKSDKKEELSEVMYVIAMTKAKTRGSLTDVKKSFV